MAGLWIYDFEGCAYGETVENAYGLTRVWGETGGVLCINTGIETDAENGYAIRSSEAAHAFKFDAPSDDADSADVEMLLRVSSAGNDAWYPAMCRGSGTIESQYGYGIQRRSTGFQIRQWTNTNNGGGTSIATTPVGADTTLGFDLLRFRVNGTSLKAKEWGGTLGDEPDWIHEITNTAHSSGWIGFYQRSSFIDQAIDKIAIATGGGEASFAVEDATEIFRLRHNPRTNKVIPVLSFPTVTDIGATCVRPRVTKGY